MPSEDGRLSPFGSPVSSSPTALCSLSLLQPDCFPGSWLLADGECFVLFVLSPRLGWAKCEVMRAEMRDLGCWDRRSWLEQFLAFSGAFIFPPAF